MAWSRFDFILCFAVGPGCGCGWYDTLFTLLRGGNMNMQPSDGDTTDWLPRRVPDLTTRRAVRDAFLAGRIDGTVAGGYIDFLERAFIPVDPTDECAQLLSANPGAEGAKVSTGAVGAHATRLKELAAHWKFLQDRRRGLALSRTITHVRRP